MDNNQAVMQIRTRKLGLLISEARQITRRTQEECAATLGITVDEFAAIERGRKAPSLPELESLAYYLNIPLEHFWGNETLLKKGLDRNIAISLKELRNRVLGTKLRMARAQKNLSTDELSQKCSVPAEQIRLYESGKIAIPLPELEALAKVLDIRLSDIFDQQGPVGEWHSQHQEIQKFLGLHPNIREFILKPVNAPYIDVAIRLSELNVEKLRDLAEGLLEITF